MNMVKQEQLPFMSIAKKHFDMSGSCSCFTMLMARIRWDSMP